MNSFQELGLSDNILRAIEKMGFETPSDIQVNAIPHLLKGDKDFIGLAQTGTGKTAAFGLPLLERIDPSQKHTQGLVLAPTRELGKQISVQLEKYSKFLDKINVLAVYGGAAITNQIAALRKPQHIIIATPGRLIDLIKRKSIDLSRLKYLVLDEADEMLNMGFKEEIDKILKYAPEDKKTWLFSATMPKEMIRIVAQYMEDPVEVRINPKDEVNVNINHQYALVKHSDKPDALRRFLDVNASIRCVIFCRTKIGTQNLAELLIRNNYKADALHGDLSQAQRDRVMSRFRSTELAILVATDVAARGIDVNDLTHVFHYNLPDDVSYYTHRSGRTARAGKKGISLSFINGKELYRIGKLKRTLKVEFEKVAVPHVEEIAKIRIEAWAENLIGLKTRENINPAIMMQASMMFANLSKEELIEKLLIQQMKMLTSSGNKDLNDSERGGGDRFGRNDRRGSRNRSGGSRRNSYGSKKGSGQGRKKHYGKGSSSTKRRPKKKYRE